MEDGEKEEPRARGPLARVLLDPSSTLKPEKQRDHCQDADRLATADAILTTSPPLSLRPKMAGNDGEEKHQSRLKLRFASVCVFDSVLPHLATLAAGRGLKRAHVPIVWRVQRGP